MKIIDRKWINPLLLGSIVLGSGGGGKTNNLAFLLDDILTKYNSITLLDINDIKDDSNFCSTGMIGSVQMIDDFCFTGEEGIDTIKELEIIKGKEVNGIYPFEGAGVNTLYPIVVAGLMGLPVVDGDAMGRAFPEIQMTVFQINEEEITPFILKDTRNGIHILKEEDTFMHELEIRRILNELDNIGYFSCSFKNGKKLKEYLIPSTISLTRDIGEAFIKNTSYETILEDLIFATKNSCYGSAIELFKGRVSSIDSNDGMWQTINIKGINNYEKKNYKIMSKNEYLITFVDDKISCMVPDIITTIDLKTLDPITIENICKDLEVAIIGIPAPLNLKTDKALSIIGPASFGYKSTYKSLEEIYYNYYF
ncbi:MAG: DUF917 domain-containing protein [Tissierellales bacterium]|nr:DUF917 domain-containing protein [Tissierellales bacterium]